MHAAAGGQLVLAPGPALLGDPVGIGLGGGTRSDRVLLAARLDEAVLLEAFADRVRTEDRLEPDARGRLKARRITRLDRLVISERLIENPDAASIQAALLAQVRAEGLGVLHWGDGARRLRERAAFLRAAGQAEAPDLSDAALLADLGAWLAPLLPGRSSLADIAPGTLDNALRGLIDWTAMQALDRLAPDRWTTPPRAGRRWRRGCRSCSAWTSIPWWPAAARP